MARAYPQSQPIDDDPDHSPSEWQTLRQELVHLLQQVDSRVTRAQATPTSERYGEPENDARHRDALKSVARAITRFEDSAPATPAQMAPNPRDSLQAAINQIRARRPEATAQPQQLAPQMSSAPRDTVVIDKLAQSVNGMTGRLERLETEIRAQIRTGANVKDVADQVSQLAHVVELLAGAVGETGQVKRLEGQIASLGKIMSQGREMDVQALTRRLDDVAATVGQLAELQVHYADKVQNPVETQAFQSGMRSIEDSVRSVYDRIDALERHDSLSPRDLEHVTAEMARFTEALRDGQQQPVHLVELVDALNARISDIESGDRLLHGLRKDLAALRDAVVVSLTPRFDAIEQRMDSLSTRDDMAEIGRQIGALGDRIADRPIDPGIGQLEAQVRQLVARMDQTGETLSGLAKLYSGEPQQAQMPDFDAVADLVAARAAEAVQRSAPVGPGPDLDAMADMVAMRTFEAVQRHNPVDTHLTDTLNGLEGRIAKMLQSMQRDPEVDAFDGVQAGISEVNERLKRLESSLLERSSAAAPVAEPAPSDMAAFIADAEQPKPTPRPRVDTMPRSPVEDAPLVAPAFREPTGPVASALEIKNGPRRQHPGLDDTVEPVPEGRPAAPLPPPGFEPAKIALPPAPQPSISFAEEDAADAPVPDTPVTPSSRNTFIEAARRAAQRQTPKAEPTANSLIGRAFARFQPDAAPAERQPTPEKPARKNKAEKPARAAKAEPVIVPPAGAAGSEPMIATDAATPKADAKESFLSRNRKTILLAAAVVALAFLTLNLVAQRMNEAGPAAPAAATDAAPATPAPTDAPATTGDIGADTGIAPVLGSSQEIPPRVIPMVDSMKTAAVDKSAALGFSAAPLQTMPSAFEAATQVATADPTVPTPKVAPLVPEAETPSPVKVDLPPENVGPIELRQAAANGDARAQFEIAAIYTEGRAVPQDMKAAATWYERAAAQGFAPAQYRLGSLYENGSGVSKDLNTAKLWYERAAEAGNRMSMHNLAALYAGGQLGKQQFDSAAKWFEEAASRGLTDSQFNLGMLYARGLGVPQSLPDSFKWFGLAAKSGDKDAAKARDDIARSLDADTVARITAEVNAFKPAPIDLQANFAPIGTWTKSFDPGETITTRDIVANVQKALGKLGYDIGTPDGIAGKKTQDAIKAFEGATGMSQVGQINPRLLAVLGSQPV
jgi:localization factor PodJL